MGFYHFELPDQPSGYELNYDVSVVVGIGTDVDNQIANPSVEFNVVGWGAVGGATAVAQSATEQRRGAYSLGVTPDVGLNDGVYGDYNSRGATRHSVGVDVHLPAGYDYLVYAADNAGARISPLQAVTGTGHWQRITFTYLETAAVDRRLYIVKDGSTNVNPFYVDGALVAECNYTITYFDGDSVGMLATRKDFYWNGADHGSTSTMKAQTRQAGQLVNLSDYGFRLTAIVGLGMGLFSNISTPLPNVGGEEYQQSISQARSFDLVGRIYADGTQQMLQRRRALQQVLHPHGAPLDQPMQMFITAKDNCGNVIGDTVVATCQYEGGLEGNITGNYGEQMSLRFRVFLPYLARDGSGGGAALTVQQTTPAIGYVLSYNTATGVWNDLAGGTDAIVHALAWGPDGCLYAAGDIMTAGGVAVNRIARYDPITDAWYPLGIPPNDGVDDAVNSIAFDANGNLYVVGEFHNAGGAGALHAAVWNITTATWAPLGAGLDDWGTAVTVNTDGNVVAGGLFLNAGGGAAAYVAVWDGAAWSEPDGGMNNIVYGLEHDILGNVYACGIFTLAGGGGANRIAMLDRITTTWGALGSGLNAGANQMKMAPDGSIYVVGPFATAGGITVNSIARWDGAWHALGSGLVGDATTLAIDGNSVWMAGSLTSAGGVPMPDALTRWNGSSYVYVPMAAGIGGGNAMMFVNDTWYFSGNIAWATLADSVTVVNSRGINKPKFRIDHSAGTAAAQVYQITNYTTEDVLYFYLTLMPGERVEIDTEKATITSNFRGNLISTLLPGSNLATFNLAPGNNRIGVFITTTGGAAPLPPTVIWWEDHLDSIDGAIYPE